MEHVFEPVGAMKRRSRHDVEADLEKDPVLEEIGQKIQALRRHKKWKQADLAEHAGIQTVTVFAAESGLQNLTVKTLTKIAGALGVEIYELMPGSPLSHMDGKNVPSTVEAIDTVLQEMQRAMKVLETGRSALERAYTTKRAPRH